MAQEIEYRFLLAALPDFKNIDPLPITQGYLSTEPERTVRVRRIGDDAWITIKGLKTAGSGLEFEYKIPVEEAVQILTLCGEANTLDKDRFEWKSPDGHIWEVDKFKGRHEGLIIAEIELPSLKTAFEKPHWLNGKDITEDTRFANARLTQISSEKMMENIASVLTPR
jgi:adenylate cyclase